MPQNPGEDAVRAIRASVWGAPDEALGGLPLGAAFAAFALGFIVGEETRARLTQRSLDARVARARARDRPRSGAGRSHRRAHDRARREPLSPSASGSRLRLRFRAAALGLELLVGHVHVGLVAVVADQREHDAEGRPRTAG